MTEIERRTEVTEAPAVTEQPTPSGPTEPTPSGPTEPAPSVRSSYGRSYVSRTLEIRPSSAELARRIVVLIFGLIQLLIGLRVVLLLLNAREANALVSFILDLSQVFVGPFEGVLRTNALHAAGSTLDLAAIVAFVGWSVLELIVLWILNVFRREPA